MPFAFRQQQRDQVVINRDCALVAVFLWSIEPNAVGLGFLQRSLNAQRLGGWIKIGPAQREDLVTARRGRADDGKQVVPSETLNKFPQLVIFQRCAVIAFTACRHLVDVIAWIKC